MNKLKNENGAITIIVLVTILFSVAFLISSYVIIKNKVQVQKEIISETKKAYEDGKSMEEIYNSNFSTSEAIPIYTKEQYLKIGSNEEVKVNNKYYTFSSTGTYILMNSLELYESELPLNWDAPEYVFENTDGVIDYSGYIVRVIYANNTEDIFDGNTN